MLYLSALAIDCGTRPDLKISPEKLKDATVDKKYLLTFSIANNHTPVGGYHIKSGKLPKGLELAHKKTEPWGNIGMIKGTPTEAGDFKIVIAAWAFGTQCAGQSGSREYILHVKDNKK
ncbi:MAG: hypothetical protein D6B27_08370 [Gammaproteobacteria bacterium]|nr:MAG: hypothetical protein D6B27_08370 [Gammaproteobacteria bacterium]